MSNDLVSTPPRLGEAVVIAPARAGLVVPDPDLGDVLPAAGRTVVWSTYWQRLALDGDVVVPAPAAKPAGRPGRASSTEA